MNSINSKLSFILILVMFSYGCSTTTIGSSKTVSIDGLPSSTLILDERELAQKLSNSEIGDIVYRYNPAGEIESEYIVSYSYTAASGNRCRELKVNSYKASLTNKDLICKSAFKDDWYWPRDVISE